MIVTNFVRIGWASHLRRFNHVTSLVLAEADRDVTPPGPSAPGETAAALATSPRRGAPAPRRGPTRHPDRPTAPGPSQHRVRGPACLRATPPVLPERPPHRRG